MNANRHIDEDDLILYALHLLTGPQYDAVESSLKTDPAVALRLGELRNLLGLYAEVVTQPVQAPAGSRERLLQTIAGEPSRPAEQSASVPTPLPFKPPVSGGRPKPAPVSLWAGWAIAAMLAITVGVLGQRWLSARNTLGQKDAQLASLATNVSALSAQRNQLQSKLGEQALQAAALKDETAAAQSGAASLQSKAATLQSKAATLQSKAATLQNELAGQSVRLSQEAARAAEAERARNQLQDTLAEQRAQLAQASAATDNAQVLAALTDPTALRVVMTKPKAKPAPTGRAAYVLNKGTLVFLGSNMAALRPSQIYELWLMPADGSSPIPAGTFQPDARGNATVAFAHFPRAVPAKGFAVTVEAAGGSQVPTLPLFLVGS